MPTAPTIVLIGVGAMGGLTLGILRSQLPQARVIAVDRDPHAAQTANAAKVEFHLLDVEGEELPLEGCDLVLNTAGPYFGGSAPVAKAAIAAGCDYLDICDDAEGTDAVLMLHDAARKAGVTVVSGAGFAPGLSNSMAVWLARENAQLDGIDIAWVLHNASPSGFAPLQHMMHMAMNPCPQWRDGDVVQTPGFRPETGKRYRFPDPVGDFTCFDTAHPEPLTLPLKFPRLRTVACKGGLMPEWVNGAFAGAARLGFGYPDLAVEFDGLSINAQEFLWRTITAQRETYPANVGPDLTTVVVTGYCGDEQLDALALVDHAHFGRATAVGLVAFTLIALKKRCAPGAYGPEIFDAEEVLECLAHVSAAEHAFPDGVLRASAAGFERLC